MQSKVDVAVHGTDMLGECPIWDDRSGRLWWVDSRGPSIKSVVPGGNGIVVHALREPVGSIAFCDSRRMLAATKSGFHFFDPASGALAPIVNPEPGLPGNRLNDGRCDRQGRFWAGSMSDVSRDPVGTLYRLDPDYSVTPLRSGIIIPNSLAWSPDGRTMYFADTNRHCIWAWDYDPASGAATRERVFAGTGNGRPDGSCVDADGCLWNAEYGAGRLVRYTPAGKVDRYLELPVANPTCCCFGGAGLDVMYVTTARQRLTEEELARQPLAGSVLAVRTGTRGLPESRFKA